MFDSSEPLPISMWAASLEGAFLSAEVLSVVMLRTLSMSGLRPMEPAEPLRMFLEKPPAFAASGVAAWQAATSGLRADQICAVYMRHLRQEVRSNSDRLLLSAAAEPPPRAA